MKKVLLLSLGLVMGFGAFAQKQVVRVEQGSKKATAVKVDVQKDIYTGTSVINNYAPQAKQSVVVNRYLNFEDAETMWTHYDLQSNGAVSNRLYQRADGSVAVVATMSHEDNQTVSDRGTGYNYAQGGDMGNWLEAPEMRAEANATGDDLRTGWPTIAPYGQNGEILVNHASGLNYWIRETAGEGQWDGPYSIPNPEGLEGQEYAFELSWPRVVTSGENNEIIHVFAAAQYQIGSEEYVNASFYCRSTDGQTWDVQWAPLFDAGEHLNIYSADDYSLSANGHTVAVLYTAVFHGHTVLYKSNDDGLTWERRIVWENPYYGCDWETDPCSLTGGATVYSPVHGSVAVGTDGVAHVAISVLPYTHEELGNTFSYYYGRTADGIAYWNDTEEGPITSADGDPNNALRLWLPDPEDPENYVYHSNDSVRFCGWVPFYEDVANFNSDMVYKEDDYIYAMYGTSAYPSIAVDPEGNLAMAYSTPDMNRVYGAQWYYRTMWISHKDAHAAGWVVAADQAAEDFIHEQDEQMSVHALSTPINNGEFWFAYSADNTPGLYWGSGASQTAATYNAIYVVKINPEGVSVGDEQIAQNPVYSVYPNPASEMIFVASSMNADATITFTNLAGQTVKVVNKNLTIGENTISINDLASGVYFCTVNANGFNQTSKVVVK